MRNYKRRTDNDKYPPDVSVRSQVFQKKKITSLLSRKINYRVCVGKHSINFNNLREDLARKWDTATAEYLESVMQEKESDP